MTSASDTQQLSQGLPEVRINVTGHDKSGRELFLSSVPAQWKAYHSNTMSFAVVYTTSESPPSLNNDEDVQKHHAVMKGNKLGLVNPGGSVCRIVDFAPGPESMMHRTQSLDYGIVIFGSVEAILESGDKRIMNPGDVCVQRGTSHAWRNTSDTEWARMAFVLQDCQPLTFDGVTLKEDLGNNTDIPAS
ncbi:hypothetical protein A0O28_0007980 [Trichoderma guizhouense]|uniref:Cupin 2 conserved barrel domain-containing protein n=1 Tax=Trichoderma guizhouense TaxID=1491466 RepID=A0A1T3CHZ5_9HYPO|nr:hypothetical protein A0O28_0007980 [Trichoderma guizhouense]